MRVGIYARLSRNKSGESTSIDRQIAACRKRLEDGWSVVAEYRDDDVSAYSGKTRPGFEQMLGDIEAGKLDIVLSYALDRLGRRPKDIERLLEAGVPFVCVRDSLDSRTASSELFIRILAAMAKMESDNTGARIRLKHEELRANGKFNGGRRPYGWLPSEAALLREGAKRILDGESLRTVSIFLMKDRTTVRRIYLSPRMVGKRTPDGEVGMPVILPEETWRKLQRILTDPSRMVAMYARGTRLLTGLLYCGICGKRMMGHRRKQERYQCYMSRGGCGRLVVGAASLEAYVEELAWKHTWEKYRSIDVKVAVRERKDADDREREEQRKELSALKSRLYPLIDMYTAGSLTLEEWQRARSDLDKQIEHLEKELQVRDEGPLEVDLSTGDKREWLRSLIEKIVIHPTTMRGRRFDKRRVEVHFR